MWTKAQIEALRKYARNGASFSDVAALTGRTRNAVAGKARREGITFSGILDHAAASASAHKAWRTKRSRLARQAKP